MKIRPMQCSRFRRGAFSLLEMLLVMIIIGVITGIAAPRFTGFLSRRRLDASAQRIATDLSSAQRMARSRSKACTVRFRSAFRSYIMPDLTDDSKTVEIFMDQDPYGIVFSSIDLGGDAEIHFDGYGKPDSAGTITIQISDYQAVLSIDAVTGGVSRL